MASVIRVIRSSGRPLEGQLEDHRVDVAAIDDDRAPVARHPRSAAPTTPGSRLVSGDMALKRWVKPVTP